MEHRVRVIPYTDRSKATCSCGTLESKERFGDRRTAKAKHDALLHLENVYGAAKAEWDERLPEYQISAKDDLDCPICGSSLDLARGDFGLLRETEPSVIQCGDGHLFEAYEKNGTLFLFTESADSDGPFDTTD